MFNNATPTVPSQKVNIALTDVAGSDADGDPLVYTVTSGPKYGEEAGAGDRQARRIRPRL